MRKAYDSERGKEADNTLEDLVYNGSTTQNWLRDKIFNPVIRWAVLICRGVLISK